MYCTCYPKQFSRRSCLERVQLLLLHISFGKTARFFTTTILLNIRLEIRALMGDNWFQESYKCQTIAPLCSLLFQAQLSASSYLAGVRRRKFLGSLNQDTLASLSQFVAAFDVFHRRWTML